MTNLTFLLENRRHVLGKGWLIVGLEVRSGAQSSCRNDKEQEKREGRAFEERFAPEL
jgi:hypothetical protein